MSPLFLTRDRGSNKAATSRRTPKLMEDLKHIVLMIAGILVAFTVVMTMVAYTVLAERRVLGFIQGRLGPNRVGPGGFCSRSPI